MAGVRSRPQQKVNLLPSRILQRVLLLLCPFSGCTGTGPGADDSGGVRLDTGASTLDDTGASDSGVAAGDSGISETGHDTGAESGGGETGGGDTAADTGTGFDATIFGETDDYSIGEVAFRAGDVNADGIMDVWLGKNNVDPRAAYLFEGPLSGTLTTADAAVRLTSSSGGYFPRFGPMIAAAGDVDDDGTTDMLFGVSVFGDAEEGIAILMLGPLSGEVYLEAADAYILGEEEESEVGHSVAGGGDLNGDGWDDLLISGPGADVSGAYSAEGDCPGSDHGEPGADEGASAGITWLFLGPVTGTRTVSEADASLTGEDGYDWAGASVAGAGDLDGDGLPDVLVHAANQCELAEGGGAAYVVLAPFSGTGSLADADGKIMAVESQFLVANAGDVDGDGTPDILWKGQDATMREDSAFLFSGPALGDAELSEATMRMDRSATAESVDYDYTSAPGDLNADGFDDLLFVDPVADRDTYAGAAYVFQGPLSGVQDLSEADIMISGPTPFGMFGSSAAGLGDTNGDGLPDLLFGAPYDSTAGTYAGAAYLLLGGGSILGAL